MNDTERRDLFAANAIAGVLACPIYTAAIDQIAQSVKAAGQTLDNGDISKMYAEFAYTIADAMMERRKEGAK